jgi:uncharacterized protein YecE (DUF72 family)
MLYLGTSGFSYEDWKGRFYPPTLARDRMLGYYAERFNAVEINASFYRIPSPDAMRSLISRSGEKLRFAIKANQAMTHQGDRSERTRTAFLRAVEPVQSAGRLGALLFQFPFRFHATAENRAYLSDLVRCFAGLPTVIEIRHESWDHAEGRAFFREGG